MAKNVTDIAASVKARLVAQAKEHGEEAQSLLTRYASERFLYRLSQSKYKDKFLLKGASLFALWFNRQTQFPITLPVALTDGFVENAMVASRWSGFINRNRMKNFSDLEEVIQSLRAFFTPIIEAEKDIEEFGLHWTAASGWKE